MTTVAPLDRGSKLSWDDAGRRTDKVIVRPDPGTYVTARLFTMFVQPGDLLVVTGELNVTNNTGRSLTTGAVTGKQYAVGVATSLWIYDANAPADVRPATWYRLGTNGENATPDDHHIQQGLTRPYQVPGDWDPTHQMGIVLRVDAHSTAAGSNPTADYLLVEQHGVLMAMQYPANVPVDPDVAELQDQVAAQAAQLALLTEQVAALTPQEG